MTLEGPRVLNKNLTGVSCQTDGEYGVMENFDGQGWEAVGVKIAAQRTYFDLSGYNRESLTTFFQGVDFQYAAPPATSDSHLFVIDLITTERLSNAEIVATYGTAAPGLFTATGFPESTFNQEQVIYARRRTYVQDWSAPLPTPSTQFPPLLSTDLWGTCSAASADKIHITRILQGGNINKLFHVPPVNVVVAVVVAEEKELAYLARQKRSYEIQPKE